MKRWKRLRSESPSTKRFSSSVSLGRIGRTATRVPSRKTISPSNSAGYREAGMRGVVSPLFDRRAAGIRRAIRSDADWRPASDSILWGHKEDVMDRDPNELEQFDDDFAAGGEVEYEEIEDDDTAAE